MPRVLNKRIDKIPSDAVYVGRPSKWGNEWDSVAEHREYFQNVMTMPTEWALYTQRIMRELPIMELLPP